MRGEVSSELCKISGYVKPSKKTGPLRKSETAYSISIDAWPVSYGISIKNGYATQVFPGIYD